jgi:transcriptional regulator with XRE-family HTH domain
LDWTQAELAQRVGYSVATIRKLERDELRPSKRLAEQLAHGLDVAVTHHASVVSFARSTATPRLEPDAQPIHEHRRSNLPAQLTPFFGRTVVRRDSPPPAPYVHPDPCQCTGDGDLDTARALAEEVQAVTLNINDPESKHRSLQLFGLLAGLHEDYDACYQYHQQIHSLNRSYFPFTTSWESMGLCMAACGLNDMSAARQHLQRVLEISVIHQWPPNAAKGLTFAAIIAAKSGKSERATELLALVFHHPLSPKGWLEQWPLITRLRAELEATLTPERFQAAWQRGETLDLLATAKEQLAELAGENRADISGATCKAAI